MRATSSLWGRRGGGRPQRAGSVAGPVAAVAVVAVGVSLALAVLVTEGAGTADSPANPIGSGATSSLPSRTADPARRFLDQYVDPDGRVVRRDQGGDTVSEGQAYAMLLAASIDDRPRFERVWSWTRTHLTRPDGLLSWSWRDGAVVDHNSAADADLDTAHALVLAGSHFHRPDLRAAGVKLGAHILDHETRTTRRGRILLAGQWATEQPYRVNPSYASPTAYRLLADASGDGRWHDLAKGDLAVVDALLARSPLPSDWAQVKSDGTVEAMPPPGGGDVVFGLDAQRITTRYAVDCSAAGRAVSERIGQRLPTAAADVRGIYDLGGAPRVGWRHPVAVVASASAAEVAGRDADSAKLLDAARAFDRHFPTYYGGAWTALGTRLLQEPSTLGVACPPSPQEPRP